MVDAAIPGVAAEFHVDAIVRQGQGRSLLLVERVEAGGRDRDLWKASRSRLQVQADQVIGCRLFERDRVDDARHRIHHRRSRDAERVDVAAVERARIHGSPDRLLPDDASGGGAQGGDQVALVGDDHQVAHDQRLRVDRVAQVRRGPSRDQGGEGRLVGVEAIAEIVTVIGGPIGGGGRDAGPGDGEDGEARDGEGDDGGTKVVAQASMIMRKSDGFCMSATPERSVAPNAISRA